MSESNVDERVTIYLAAQQTETSRPLNVVHERRKRSLEITVAPEPSNTAKKARDTTSRGWTASEQINETNLSEITYTFDDNTQIAGIISSRDKFFHKLQNTNTSIRIGSSSKRKDRGFDLEEAAVATNFFYKDLFGDGSVQRLNRIIQQYCRIDEMEVMETAAYKAETMSKDSDNSFHYTFEVLGRILRDSACVTEHLVDIKAFQCNLHHFEFIEEPDHLKVRASAGDPSLLKLFKAERLEYSSGVGNSTLCQQYLAAKIALPVENIKNIVRRAKLLQTIANVLGEGVLILVSSKSLSR